jgi:molybdopterin biosynthesis enzyme MoaB
LTFLLTNLKDAIESSLDSRFAVQKKQILSDSLEKIEQLLKDWCDVDDAPNVIFTMGGTGFSVGFWKPSPQFTCLV